MVRLYQKYASPHLLKQAGYDKLAAFTAFTPLEGNQIQRLMDFKRTGFVLFKYPPLKNSAVSEETYDGFKTRFKLLIEGEQLTYNEFCERLALEDHPKKAAYAQWLNDLRNRERLIGNSNSDNDNEVAEVPYYRAFLATISDEITRKTLEMQLNQAAFRDISNGFLMPLMWDSARNSATDYITSQSIHQVEVQLKPKGGYFLTVSVDLTKLQIPKKLLKPGDASHWEPAPDADPKALARFTLVLDGTIKEINGQKQIVNTILSTTREEFDARVSPVLNQYLVNPAAISDNVKVQKLFLLKRALWDKLPIIRGFVDNFLTQKINTALEGPQQGEFFFDFYSAAAKLRKKLYNAPSQLQIFDEILDDIVASVQQGKFASVNLKDLQRFSWEAGIYRAKDLLAKQTELALTPAGEEAFHHAQKSVQLIDEMLTHPLAKEWEQKYPGAVVQTEMTRLVMTPDTSINGYRYHFQYRILRIKDAQGKDIVAPEKGRTCLAECDAEMIVPHKDKPTLNLGTVGCSHRLLRKWPSFWTYFCAAKEDAQKVKILLSRRFKKQSLINNLVSFKVEAGTPHRLQGRFFSQLYQQGKAVFPSASSGKAHNNQRKRRQVFQSFLGDLRQAAKNSLLIGVTTGKLRRLELKHGFAVPRSSQNYDQLWAQKGAAGLFSYYAQVSRFKHANLHHRALAKTMADRLLNFPDPITARRYIKQQLDRLNCNPNGLFVRLACIALQKYDDQIAAQNQQQCERKNNALAA